MCEQIMLLRHTVFECYPICLSTLFVGTPGTSKGRRFKSIFFPLFLSCSHFYSSIFILFVFFDKFFTASILGEVASGAASDAQETWPRCFLQFPWQKCCSEYKEINVTRHIGTDQLSPATCFSFQTLIADINSMIF